MKYKRFFGIITVICTLIILTNLLYEVNPIVYGLTREEPRSSTVVNAVEVIKAGDYSYYEFNTAGPRIANPSLNGNYQEENGQNVNVTVYDASACHPPDSSDEADLTTCTAFIFTENKTSSSVNVPLQQGKTYYLSFANQNDDRSVTVNMKFVNKWVIFIQVPDNKIIPPPPEQLTNDCTQIHIRNTVQDCRNYMQGTYVNMKLIKHDQPPGCSSHCDIDFNFEHMQDKDMPSMLVTILTSLTPEQLSKFPFEHYRAFLSQTFNQLPPQVVREIVNLHPELARFNGTFIPPKQ